MKAKVAIIEDNEDNRLLVRAILEETCEVVEYETGPAALQGLKSSSPEVVLLDLSLPGMDGVEVLREIRRNPILSRLYVVALTAHAMNGDRDRYLREGFDEYLTKPIVDEEVLLEAVRRGQGGRP